MHGSFSRPKRENRYKALQLLLRAEPITDTRPVAGISFSCRPAAASIHSNVDVYSCSYPISNAPHKAPIIRVYGQAVPHAGHHHAGGGRRQRRRRPSRVSRRTVAPAWGGREGRHRGQRRRRGALFRRRHLARLLHGDSPGRRRRLSAGGGRIGTRCRGGGIILIVG